MPRDLPSTYKFTVTSGERTVSLRDAVTAVWSGQASPNDFEVEIAPVIPQSPSYLRGREVEYSNQSPQPLVSHGSSTTEV